MRSTGEVMASAADLPTALAKAERRRALRSRPPGRPSCRCGRGQAGGRRGRGRPRRLGFELVATEGTARTSPAGSSSATSRRSRTRAPTSPPSSTSRRERCDLVVNTPQGRGARGRLPDPRGCARRSRPVHHDDLRRRGGGARDRQRPGGVRAVAAGTHRGGGMSEAAAVLAGRARAESASGWYDRVVPALLRLGGAPSSPENRASSSCWRRRESAAAADEPLSGAARRARLPDRSDRRSTRALSLAAGDAIHVLGPLGAGSTWTWRDRSSSRAASGSRPCRTCPRRSAAAGAARLPQRRARGGRGAAPGAEVVVPGS